MISFLGLTGNGLKRLERDGIGHVFFSVCPCFRLIRSILRSSSNSVNRWRKVVQQLSIFLEVCCFTQMIYFVDHQNGKDKIISLVLALTQL